MSKNIKHSMHIKLVIIGLAFSLFLALLVPFVNYLKMNNNSSLNNYVAYTEEEEEYYKRLDEVYDEYNDEDKDFSHLAITSTFSVLQQYVSDFTFSDMTKGRMREVADLMLDEVDHDDGSITYTSKDEEAIKEGLTDYFKHFDSDLSEDTRKQMAQDVFDHVDNYLEFKQVEENNTNNNACISTGNTQASVFLNMTTDEYVATMGPIAQADYSRTGVFASLTIAQSILESGWGKSDLAQKYNNLFGITCGSWDNCVFLRDREWRIFANVEESVDNHSAILSNDSVYPGALSATSGKEQLNMIADIYAPPSDGNDNYAGKVSELIDQYNLEQWDVPMNVSSNLCYTGSGQWTIRTVAPTSSDVAFTRKSDNRGQCVWYAQGRAYEVVLELAENGVITDDQATSIRDKLFSIYGNAGEWVSKSSGILPTSTDINDLEAGAIISWTKPGGYGHVAFIEEVTSDSVTITEGWATNTTSCPYDWNCINFNMKTMSIDEFYDSYGPYYTGDYDFSGYIYPLKG